jgi:hypothetical protein
MDWTTIAMERWMTIPLVDAKRAKREIAIQVWRSMRVWGRVSAARCLVLEGSGTESVKARSYRAKRSVMAKMTTATESSTINASAKGVNVERSA